MSQLAKHVPRKVPFLHGKRELGGGFKDFFLQLNTWGNDPFNWLEITN